MRAGSALLETRASCVAPAASRRTRVHYGSHLATVRGWIETHAAGWLLAHRSRPYRRLMSGRNQCLARELHPLSHPRRQQMRRRLDELEQLGISDVLNPAAVVALVEPFARVGDRHAFGFSSRSQLTDI